MAAVESQALSTPPISKVGWKWQEGLPDGGRLGIGFSTLPVIFACLSSDKDHELRIVHDQNPKISPTTPFLSVSSNRYHIRHSVFRHSIPTHRGHRQRRRPEFATMSRPTTTDDLVRRLGDSGTDAKERIALQALATTMIQLFHEETPLALAPEAAALATVVTHDGYKMLLWVFVDAVTKGTADGRILHPRLCKDFVHVLRSSSTRNNDDAAKPLDMRLGQVMESIRTRLVLSVQQAEPDTQYQLVSTLASVLNAMNDVKTKSISRESLHKPLLDKLEKLSKDKEIRLAQAASYAYEALRCIPDSEGPYKILLQNMVKVVGAASKIAGAVTTIDPSKLFEGIVALGEVPELISSMVEVVQSISDNVEHTRGITEAVNKQRKSKRWYVALRYTDMLIEARAFAGLKQFIQDVPCRQGIDFLCGLCAQLEHAWEAAANSDSVHTQFIQDELQAIVNLLPDPKSRSDVLRPVGKNGSEDCKRMGAWKEAMLKTFGHSSSPNSIANPASTEQDNPYTYAVGCHTIMDSALTADLLSKAWLRCPEAQLFYADAVLRQYYLSGDEYLLQIQRISGQLLPMEQCYVNLDIIETSHLLNKGDSSISHNSKASVTLENLFEPRTCSDRNSRVPRRLLIRGSAGVGKTTLCKKIVYEFTRSQVNPDFSSWKTLYDRVLWLPLRNLKLHKANSSYRLMDLFRDEFFSLSGESEIFAKALHDHCTKKPGSSHTLFLLDGLDEVSHQLDSEHEMARFLQHLLNQPDVIITSRPGSKLPAGLAPLDCELVTTGFHRDQANEYIRHSLVEAKKIESLQWFLYDHEMLSNLVKIPVQLDALCYTWDDAPGSQGYPDAASKKITTSAAVYQAIERKLWCKDMPRLKKRLPDGELITENTARALRSHKQIYALVKDEVCFVQFLAFSGFVNDIIYFEQRYCDIVQDNMDSSRLSVLLDDFLMNFSCLRTLEATKPSAQRTMSPNDSHRTYHFIHLTYQEFFAAQYFVTHWRARTRLSCLNFDDGRVTSVGTQDFIGQNKYEPRYSVFWSFVVGLLHDSDGTIEHSTSSVTRSLERFFSALEHEPRDIVGLAHQKLVVRCLAEIDPAQDMAIFDSQCKVLHEWVVYELHTRADSSILRSFSSLPERISGHILQAGTRPTRTFIKRSHQFRAASSTLSQDIHKRRHRLGESGHISSLDRLPFLPSDVLHVISERLLQHSPIKNDFILTRLLDRHLVDALPCLLECLGHPTGYVRANVAKVFVEITSQKRTLPAVVVAALILRVDDTVENVASLATSALCNLRPFPEQAVQPLRARLRDTNNDIRKSTLRSIVKASVISGEILMEIMEMLLNPSPNISSDAELALRSVHHAIPNPVLERLVHLLNSAFEAEQSAAIKYICAVQPPMFIGSRKKDHLSDHVLDTLVALLRQNPNENIRSAAALALQKTAADLPSHIYQELAAGLDDPSGNVRNCTALVLNRHLTSHVQEADIIFLSLFSYWEALHDEDTCNVTGSSKKHRDAVYDRATLHVSYFSLSEALPLSPTTMCILAQKLEKSTTSPRIRTQILNMFKRQAERLPESVIHTVVTCRRRILNNTRHRDTSPRTTEARMMLVSFNAVLTSCQSLPANIVSDLLGQLSRNDMHLTYHAVNALSRPDLVSRDVLSGIAALLSHADPEISSLAASVLKSKDTLHVDIVEMMLKYMARNYDFVDIYPNEDIIRHVFDRPDAEFYRILKKNKEITRHLFEFSLDLALFGTAFWYADGNTHYVIVVHGRRRRVPKEDLPITPEEIAEELDIPMSVGQASEQRNDPSPRQDLSPGPGFLLRGWYLLVSLFVYVLAWFTWFAFS